MCNLYKMRANVAEVGQLFGARADVGANFGEEVYPGYPGLVVAEGTARTMTWGFPLTLKGKQGQALKPKPVNNAREDKLASPFWRDSFIKRRCLIPISAWAEAEGAKGRMTRTWYSLQGTDLFAVGGVWRPTLEWGDAYSMVMVDGCAQMADVHDRMPVVLGKQDWQDWLGSDPTRAFALCQTSSPSLSVDRTSESWAKPRGGGVPTEPRSRDSSDCTYALAAMHLNDAGTLNSHAGAPCVEQTLNLRRDSFSTASARDQIAVLVQPHAALQKILASQLDSIGNRFSVAGRQQNDVAGRCNVEL